MNKWQNVNLWQKQARSAWPCGVWISRVRYRSKIIIILNPTFEESFILRVQVRKSVTRNSRGFFCWSNISRVLLYKSTTMLRVLVSKTANLGKNTLVVSSPSSQIYLQSRSLWGDKKQKKPKIIYQSPSGVKTTLTAEQIYRSKLPLKQEYEYAWIPKQTRPLKESKMEQPFLAPMQLRLFIFLAELQAV